MNKIVPVFIEFFDHQSEPTWMNRTELHDFVPEQVYQLGWLVDEDETCYKVSGQICDDGDVGDTIVILKSTVKEIKKLKIKMPKWKKK